MKNSIKSKRQKGITLIALVITIIVLLILAAVSIATLTGENGILTKANNAKTNNTIGEEQEQIKLAYDAVMADNYEKGDYTSGVTASKLQEELDKIKEGTTVEGEGTIKVTFKSGNSYNVNGITGEIEELGNSNQDGNTGETMAVTDLEVGDYVKYGEKLTKQTYTTKMEETGYETNQTFETDTEVLWQVMRNDGSNVRLVAVSNTLSNDDTPEGLYLVGETGWTNEEKVLNDLCGSLYSNSSYGDAKCFDLRDLTSAEGQDLIGFSCDYMEGGDKLRESLESGIDSNNNLSCFWLPDVYTYYIDYGFDLMGFTFWNGRVEGGNLSREPEVMGVRPVVDLKNGVEVDTTYTDKDGTSKDTAYILK